MTPAAEQILAPETALPAETALAAQRTPAAEQTLAAETALLAEQTLSAEKAAGGGRRMDGPDKVSGRARYAYEHALRDVAYVWPIAATIAKGEITAVRADHALAQPGVLSVITPDNAVRLAPLDPDEDQELALFQSHAVAFRGQFIAAVVATTLETARHAADQVIIDYAAADHDVFLRADHPKLYAPEHVNPHYPTDTVLGDFDAAFEAAPVRIDATYRTPGQHNNPMEPHATIASWDGDQLTLIDSNQGPARVKQTIARLFRLDPSQVRVVTEHVGGGFGAKAMLHPQVVLATMAARVVDRPVKCTLTRQHMFAVGGHRSPSIQRVRLGATRDGSLTAIAHDVFQHSSTLSEFAEPSAIATRRMYAGANRRTTHRLVRLDVPTPTWMRAPGEAPGMFALESALDELAVACRIDPVDLRCRNEPPVEPESGRPWSSRNLVACLREGARRFGWAPRDPTPGGRRHGRWLVGTGMASSSYPARAMPSQAVVTVDQRGCYQVLIGAVDIGTGARTMLRQVAAEALAVAAEMVEVHVGDTDLPDAMGAGGSMGTASWSWAVVNACRCLRERINRDYGGAVPVGGLSARADTHDEVAALGRYACYSFGAQFVEVRVDMDTGEVRVPRMLGVFAAGRIIDATLARSQFVGGMTMGLSMALMEENHFDAAFGDFAHRDLASYHIATNADVGDIEALWIDEDEQHLGPAGAKGIGEVGIVGTAAAIANAVYHATGTRVRDLPIRLDQLLGLGT